MKFTIFTGFYNYVDTIQELADSVFSQTHVNWEWIVWDDFSENPQVNELLDNLVNLDARVKRAYPSAKKEFYWNPPIEMSTGEICVVLDSDDAMLPRLLETYAHNFRKFPDVQMISCNSEMRNDNVNGNLRSLRYINYDKNCNVFESLQDTTYEYNWGDCRAWRNTVKKFSDGWQHCAEDLDKVLVSEELGKILFLPRTLHVYAYREDSISHKPEKGMLIAEENKVMMQRARERRKEEICSIEDHYDRRFEDLTPFYVSEVNFKFGGIAINYLSTTTDARGKEIIRELFYEHLIEFGIKVPCSHVICKIRNREDVDLLRDCISHYPPYETLSVEASKEFKDEVTAILNSAGKPWKWFLYNKFNCQMNYSND